LRRCSVMDWNVARAAMSELQAFSAGAILGMGFYAREPVEPWMAAA
jgi:hypothetical protein